jgi:TonB family protein
MLGSPYQGGSGMKGMLWIGLLAFASAGDATNDVVRFNANARVVLDAQGVPQQVQANERLPPTVRSAIEQHVMQWRFEPARIGGVAKPGVTHVSLDACAVPAPDGTMRMAMDYRSNGPGLAGGATVVAPPRYPVEAARANREGSFNVVMRIGADGRASVERIEAVSGAVKPFDKALREWVAAMRYVPEEVDAMPISTQMSMLVDFGLGSGGLKQMVREQQAKDAQSAGCRTAAGEGSDPRRPVVLDSPFKPITTG